MKQSGVYIFPFAPPPGGWKKIWAVEENMADKVSECQNYRFLTQEIICVSLQKPHLCIKTSFHSQITVCRLVSTCIHHHTRMWREPNVHSLGFRCIICRKFPQLALSTACFTTFPQLIFPHFKLTVESGGIIFLPHASSSGMFYHVRLNCGAFLVP